MIKGDKTLQKNKKERDQLEFVSIVDGTHIKANANIKRVVKKEIPKAAKTYEKQLMEEINEDREEHGKKPFDDKNPPEKR